MTSVEAVDPAEATETESPRRRRGSWIPVTVVVALFVGIAAWQGVARAGRIETGSASMSGGLVLPACIPSEGFWASFQADEEVVVAHTVRNPSPWPVTVISTDPEVYRFEPLEEDPADDMLFATSPSDGVPAGTKSSVVVPPGREAGMWIVNPQGDMSIGPLGWRYFDGAPLRIRSLGVERDIYVPYHGTLHVGGGSRGSDKLSKALEEACSG
jgi:hypothetical protein